ncbi:hypothetical protein FRC04_003639 [Tulasnella sp. 424]|nr:hypothetical protein FRC04_003639 [Tulasnella sp. 424]KAG8965506.1 hypothetical protein FRC05_003239 [Tulasnella sp. 425]
MENHKPLSTRGIAVVVSAGSRPPSIHHLPEEILLDIFRSSINPDTYTPLGDIIKLTLVCRLWMIVLEGAPMIWNQISAAGELAHIRKGLKLAQNVPLDILYGFGKANVGQDTFLKEVGDSISRWRSFRFFGHNVSQSSLGILGTAPAPKLVVLRLHGPFGERRDVVTLFGGAPASSELKEFSVFWIPVVLAPLRLSNLQSLTLRHVSTVSISDIFQILGDSPALEVLCLQRLEHLRLQEAHAHHVDNHPVQLTVLRDLSLELPPSFLRLLLSKVSVPNLRKLEIIGRNNSHSPSEIFIPDIPHLIHVLTAMTACVQEITITLSCVHCSIHVGGFRIGPIMFEDEPPVDHVRDAIDWIRSRLGRHLEDAPIHISIQDYGSTPDASYVEAFSARIRVTKLSLWGDPSYGSCMENLIPLLSKPAALWPYNWIFSHLEVFDTDQVFSSGSDFIVDMVRNRQAASKVGDGDETGMVAPSRLREIRLSFGEMFGSSETPPNAAFMRAVVEAADGADVYWHDVKWAGDAMDGGNGSSH